jgi:hypothetical protein
MRKFLLISIMLLSIFKMDAQNSSVTESGMTLLSLGAGVPIYGVPFEITATYGIWDDVFDVENLHFTLENLLSFKLLAPSTSNFLTFGVGASFYYTVYDDFDVFAGFIGGYGIGVPSNVDVFFKESFDYFINVGARYSFADFVGVYARASYSSFSFMTAGIYFKF